jgi:hypothetical protein
LYCHPHSPEWSTYLLSLLFYPPPQLPTMDNLRASEHSHKSTCAPPAPSKLEWFQPPACLVSFFMLMFFLGTHFSNKNESQV